VGDISQISEVGDADDYCSLLIIRATTQWFADISIVKDRAGEALEDTDFFPSNCQFFPHKL
jgi:hypothetical protein